MGGIASQTAVIHPAIPVPPAVRPVMRDSRQSCRFSRIDSNHRPRPECVHRTTHWANRCARDERRRHLHLWLQLTPHAPAEYRVPISRQPVSATFYWWVVVPVRHLRCCLALVQVAAARLTVAGVRLGSRRPISSGYVERDPLLPRELTQLKCF